MSPQRARRDLSAPIQSATPTARQPAGPVVLFIVAVLIAGMTCILYLWQQSQIVAGRQEINSLNAVLTARLQQRDDLLAQVQALESVTHVVAQANSAGMVQADPRQFTQITVSVSSQPAAIAMAGHPRQPTVDLPATNAAVTSWWQGAWDGLYSLLQ
jgi:hypothetical protein